MERREKPSIRRNSHPVFAIFKPISGSAMRAIGTLEARIK
jgi:hypothetical protein